MTSAAPRFHVHRHRARYQVPAEADAAATRHVLDRALERHAPGWLAAALAPAARRWAAEDPQAIWWLKSVDLRLTCDPALGEDAVARGWSGGVARALVRALRRGPDGDHLVRFDDRAHYLAAFARDAAAGRDGERWYFRSFDTLGALPPGGRVREALIREPAWALPALLRLRADGDLDAVLATLSDGDARRLLSLLLTELAADGPTPAEDTAMDTAALVTLTRAYGRRRARSSAALALLATVVDLAAEAPALAGRPDLAACLDAVAGLAAALDTLDGGDLLALLTDGEPGATAAAVHRLRAAGATELLPTLRRWRRLGADEPQALDAALRTLSPVTAPPAGSEPRGLATDEAGFEVDTSPGEGFVSRHAGVFLLLPSVEALGVDRALQQAAQGALAALDGTLDDRTEIAAETLPAVLRLHLLGRCLGVALEPGSPVDPALALAAGLPDPGPPGLTHLPSALDTELAHRLPALYLEGLHGAERLTGRLLAEDAMPASDDPDEPRDDSRRWALRDVETDFVLAVEPELQSLDASRDDILDRLRQITGAPPRHVLPAGCLSPPCTPLSAATLDPADQRRLAEFLTRARPLEPLAPIASPLSRALEAPAQAILRHFGRRLPGFTWSRPQHLRRQFLTGVGAVRPGVASSQGSPEGIEVEPPASPLALVLRMAGLDDATYTVPWLADTPIHLTLPRERP